MSSNSKYVGVMARAMYEANGGDCRSPMLNEDQQNWRNDQNLKVYRSLAETALKALSAALAEDGVKVLGRETGVRQHNAAVDATGFDYTAPDHTGWRRSPQMLFEAGFKAMHDAATCELGGSER